MFKVFFSTAIMSLVLNYHGRDSNNDSADFSQLGGSMDFSLNVTDVIVTVKVQTFLDLEAVLTFQLWSFLVAS